MVEATQATIAILREEKNKWERRCSITPTEVVQIVAKGIKVLVQPSSNRCYTEDEFSDAGATIQEDVSDATVIFGVKEVPIENLLPNKTYFFFSHTIKAQDYNMPLLDKLLELNIRIVDFECIREAKKEGTLPQRLVAFGRYAGIAGAFDYLRGVGEFLLQKKHQTPFVFLGSSYMYEDYEAMCEALARVKKNILKGGLPKVMCPMVFGVTGTGRVSQGILEVLEQLPHIKVEPKDLKKFCEDPANADNKRIIISQFNSEALSRPTCGKPFVKSEYYANPEGFEGYFPEYLPYVSWLVHGIYWEAKYPRVLTREDLQAAIASGKNKLMGVCDISADYEGSIGFTSRFTSIEEPFLLYNPTDGEFKEKIGDMSGEDILFHSVDHLPAEMPKEASNHFGSKLMPFVEAVVHSDFSKPFEEQTDLPAEIYGACITAHGKLTPDYEYIWKLKELNACIKPTDGDSSSAGMQGFTLVLEGHIFDKNMINDVLNICEDKALSFRIVELVVGNSATENTTVTIQGMSFNDT